MQRLCDNCLKWIAYFQELGYEFRKPKKDFADFTCKCGNRFRMIKLKPKTPEERELANEDLSGEERNRLWWLAREDLPKEESNRLFWRILFGE